MVEHRLAHGRKICCSGIRIPRTFLRCDIVLLAIGFQDDLALRSSGDGDAQSEQIMCEVFDVAIDCAAAQGVKGGPLMLTETRRLVHVHTTEKAAYCFFSPCGRQNSYSGAPACQWSIGDLV